MKKIGSDYEVEDFISNTVLTKDAFDIYVII